MSLLRVSQLVSRSHVCLRPVTIIIRENATTPAAREAAKKEQLDVTPTPPQDVVPADVISGAPSQLFSLLFTFTASLLPLLGKLSTILLIGCEMKKPHAS